MIATDAPDLSPVRDRFPGLKRRLDGLPTVFADAPGGTQVPQTVIDAMARYLQASNANAGGAFVTSRETDDVIAGARQAAADLVGSDPDEIVFGPNMTTLAFAFSRSLARRLTPDDDVVVTVLDHDANIAPWLAAAEDSGATVAWVDVRTEDGTLDLDSLNAALSPRTRVVAFTLASNALGTVTPAREIVNRAHSVGALAVGDAVHLAPHRAIDVRALGIDVLFCSAYKLFGPHLGLMYCRRTVLERLRPYKVRPAPDTVPRRWETGTQNHEGLAGLAAAADYLADVGRTFGGAKAGGDRRQAILAAMHAIERYEAALSARFLGGLHSLPEVRLYGIGDLARLSERTPTFAVRIGDLHPRAAAEELGRRGVFVWDGNYYAQAIMERLGLEATGGAVRIGFCHYHSLQDVQGVLEALEGLTRHLRWAGRRG